MTYTDNSATIAELQDAIRQLQNANAAASTGIVSPHQGILNGQPVHTVAPPTNADGSIVPGHWDTTTGLYVADGDSTSATAPATASTPGPAPTF